MGAMMVTSTCISGPGGEGEKMPPQSQCAPKGAPSPPQPPCPPSPMGHNIDVACRIRGKIFPRSFSPDTGQNPPWGEGDHLPTVGGMLPMLL